MLGILSTAIIIGMIIALCKIGFWIGYSLAIAIALYFVFLIVTVYVKSFTK